jgi:FHA domain/GAF domain
MKAMTTKHHALTTSMRASVCLHSPDQPTQLKLLDGSAGGLVLGRGEQCGLKINHSSVSREHASLHFDGSDWWVGDLNSTNGVRIGGHQINKHVLKHGDWFSLGDVFCEFRLVTDNELTQIEVRAEQQRHNSGVWLNRLANAPDRETLLANLIAAIVQLAECSRGFILAGNLQKGLSTVASYDLRSEQTARKSFGGSKAAIARAMHEHLPIMVSDPSKLSWARGRPSIISAQLRALLAIPLFHGKTPIGVAYADSNIVGKAFSELDREILSAFTEQASLILAARGIDEALGQLETCILSDANGKPEGQVQATHWQTLL